RSAAVLSLFMLNKHARRATKELAKHLDDPDETVRRTVPFALAAIGAGAEDAAGPLAKGLGHAGGGVGARSAYAVGESGPKANRAEVVKALRQALTRDPKVAVQVAAAQALWSVANQSQDVVRVLSEVVKEAGQDEGLRITAAEELGRIGAGAPKDDKEL